MRELKDLVYGRLWDQFRCVSDYSVNCAGYLGKAKYNLVSGLKIADFEDELQSEIIKKQRGNKPPRFYAVHSSAALVVNTFGIWKNSPHTLELCGKTGFEKITFEKQCPTGLGGKPPHIDLLAESEKTVIGIESKFTEHLECKLPKKRFPPSYNRDNKELCYVDEEWWEVIENERKNEENEIGQYLYVAQLIKHCMGLRNEFQNFNKSPNIILYYLFWEPKNWRDIAAFKTHREEIESFADQVRNTSIRFKYNSYPELWSKWEAKPKLEEHLNNLRSRYLLTV